MTILANTKAFLAEFENGVLTITRRSNGLHIAFQGQKVAGELLPAPWTVFRDL
ncbi:hypothetical protein QCN27_15680 [Cereibacter sp. SYSU M97828]|nr:hypothetical protein [Cereibacter flavus]